MRVLLSTSPVTTDTERLWTYNALDCAVTREVIDELLPQLDNLTTPVYAMSRALQGPVMDMALTGVLVDGYRRAQLADQLRAKYKLLKHHITAIVTDGLGLYAEGKPFNPRSNHQIAHILYDILKLPAGRATKGGGRSVDEKALMRCRNYFYAQPICNYVLEMRGVAKQIEALSARPDPDGRMRFSFSIAGTKTGRFSSFKNIMDLGMNGQNLADEMRVIFHADPGKKFAYIDLEQVQSRIVGAHIWNCIGDGKYLDACESGDLHTQVCRMTWPLAWTGDDARDRELAESTKLWGDYSIRNGAKPMGHGTNFKGTAKTIAEEAGLPAALVIAFQPKYLAGFPGIPEWWEWTRRELINSGHLISITGRKRWFFGRRWEDDTLREALAFGPQETESFILNTGLLRIWRARLPSVQALIHAHDALLIQYDEARENDLIPQLTALMRVPVPLERDRELIVPLGVTVGWNWGHYDPVHNPDGVKKWTANAPDTRTRQRATDQAAL